MIAACDRCCNDLLGAVYRTACRRLLARAVPCLSGMLRRTSKPEVIAAAVCWVIGKGNQRLGQGAGELRVKDLMSYFSLSQSSVAERGYQIMQAAGIQPATQQFAWARLTCWSLPVGGESSSCATATAPRSAVSARHEDPIG